MVARMIRVRSRSALCWRRSNGWGCCARRARRIWRGSCIKRKEGRREGKPLNGDRQREMREGGCPGESPSIGGRIRREKKTLLERLLEKDITSEEAKVVQLFHFVHMNGYLWGKEGKDLVFIPTASAKQQVGMVGVDVDVDAGEVGDDHEDDGDDDRDAGDEVENE